MTEKEKNAEQMLAGVRRLSRLPDWALLPQEKLRVIAEEILRRKSGGGESELRDVQRDELGIYVAGFLYLNGAFQRVDYQFFHETKGFEPGFTLNYVWKSDQGLGPFSQGDMGEGDAANFVDSLFYVMRYNQSPWPREAGSLGISEYLAWLPQRGIGDRDLVSNNELREQFGWHYCPYGEVVFFMYVWRLLLWCAVHFPKPNSIDWRGEITSPNFEDDLDAACRTKSINTIWEHHHWQEEQLSYEGCLYLWTHTNSTKLKHRTLVKEGLDFFDGLRVAEGSVWSANLRHLLLFRNDGTSGEALGPVLRFARAVLLDFRQLYGDPLQHCRVDSTAEIRVWDGDLNPVGRSPQDVDRYLRCAAVAWIHSFMNDRRFDSWSDAISQLHTNSRFPIIPYFYWNALDGNAKTHAVLPLWKSWTRPLEAPIFLREPRSALAPFMQPTDSKTAIVGVSVFGMKPLASDIESAAQDPYEVRIDDPYDEKRVKWIDEILIRTGVAQVDSHYYVDLAKASDDHELLLQQASISHDQLNAVASIVALLKNCNFGEGSKLQCAKVLMTSLQQKLVSYSAFDGPLFNSDDWTRQARDPNAKSRTIAEVLNWSVIVALVGVVVDEDYKQLRTALFDEDDKGAWTCLHNQLKDSLESGRGPDGSLEIRNSAGKIMLSVSYDGGERRIPHKASQARGGSQDARIYAGFQFLFDEIVLNSFRHQFGPFHSLVAAKGIEISVKVTPMIPGTSGPCEIIFRFSPVVPVHSVGPITKQRARGLSSLKFVLGKLDFEARTLKEFNLSGGGVKGPKLLPYFEDSAGVTAWRTWGVKNIPIEAFAPEES